MPPTLLTSRGKPLGWTVMRTPPPMKGDHPLPSKNQVSPPPPTPFRPMIQAWQLAPTPMSEPPPGSCSQLLPTAGRTGLDTGGVGLGVGTGVTDSVTAAVKIAGSPVRVSVHTGW